MDGFRLAFTQAESTFLNSSRPSDTVPVVVSHNQMEAEHTREYTGATIRYTLEGR